jgi:hypothetical protein
MINVITAHGSSFKGLAAYLLSDIDRQGDERVAWTETHGLATEDPEQAWRIMVATAKSQADLKAEAGVKNTGRKSHKHVMHYVLSWHPDEHGQIDRGEMLAAAKASMSYLGTYEGEKLGKGKAAKRTQHADEHQAVIVCHDEGPRKNPHVHIMLNRVHPEHGVMLPDTKDYEKLSAWALDYRRAQGKEDLCPARVQNAAKKAQGIVTNDPRKPRNVYEQEQAIEAAEPGSRKKALLEQQEKRRKELATKTAAMKANQAKAMQGLEARHVAAERQARSKTAEAVKARTAQIRASYAPRVDELTERQAAELAAFDQAKGTAAGHVRNAWKAFQTKQWMNDIRSRPLEAMKHSFTLAFDSGLQHRDIEKHHGREQSSLRGEQRREELDARRELRTDEGFKLDELRQKYHQARNDLILEQGMDQAKLTAEWKQLDRDRLATEIEDERSKRAKTSPQSDGRAPGQGQQQKKIGDDRNPLGEQVETSAETNPRDIPDGYLERLAAKQKAIDAAREQRQQEQDQSPERGD